MGTIINKIVIVHDYDKDRIKKIYEDAIKEFNTFIKDEDYGCEDDYFKNNMISSILTSFTNGEYAFMIMGDCSKAGWDTSKKFEEVRSRWIETWKHDSYRIFEVVSNEETGVYLDKHE